MSAVRKIANLPEHFLNNVSILENKESNGSLCTCRFRL